MSARPYRWLLFDADGTLFDFDQAEADALAATFEQFGYQSRRHYDAVYRQINRQIWLDFEDGKITAGRLQVRRFELLLDAIDLALDPEVFGRRYLQNLARCTDLVDGAETVLQALHGRFNLAIITNGLTDVQRPRLAASTIGHYFAAVVISEESGVAKPDPAIFDVAFSRMGWPGKDEVLIVGDSLSSDMQGGVNYGIDTCWYNPQRKPLEPALPVRYEIHSLIELLPLLGVEDSPIAP